MPISLKTTREADADILAIYAHGVATYGVKQAERYHQGLADVFRRICQWPLAMRERLEVSPPVRIYPYGSHLVVYRFDPPEDIVVLRVVHGAADWQHDAVP